MDYETLKSVFDVKDRINKAIEEEKRMSAERFKRMPSQGQIEQAYGGYAYRPTGSLMSSGSARGLQDPEVFAEVTSKGLKGFFNQRDQKVINELILPSLFTGGLVGSLGKLALAQKAAALKPLATGAGEMVPALEVAGANISNVARQALAKSLGQTKLASRTGLNTKNIGGVAKQVAKSAPVDLAEAKRQKDILQSSIKIFEEMANNPAFKANKAKYMKTIKSMQEQIDNLPK